MVMSSQDRSSDVPKEDPKDDLVDDRAIQNVGSDRLARSDFVIQAADVIRAIDTPANIAIYAPWGSGKTSLANLLRNQLGDETVGFVYFDAFKYAEAPLRREFIRQVAEELKVEDEKFSLGLYEEKVSSDLDFKGTKLWSLAKPFLVIFAAALVLVLIGSAIAATISNEKFVTEWFHIVKTVLPVIAPPAAVLGLFGSLAAGVLKITRKRFAPQSDEEFERLFKEIVCEGLKSKKSWTRLVIFIDELDRCNAEEVASTLETLRTFLEVKDCVFIVAADRSVLEEAITLRVRQETPFNIQNPYYSVGSSYLDKIFQYQWQLPPIRTRSLTRFAIELVADRKTGIWSRIDVEEVVSVLVPAHVRSPRRIKELLNAFAMAYRLAERRIENHLLGTDLRSRAPELAKLVCLQMEFPVFANELPDEPRLPELVMRLVRGDEAPLPGVTEEVMERANAYAQHRVSLDAVIAKLPDDAERTSDEQDAETPRQKVNSAQGQLLLRYLQRTEHISGPRADLIFYQDLGYAFGLPGALAERLEEAATGNRIDEVKRELDSLDSGEQISALRLLAQRVRDALPGLEGTNALRVFLGSIAAVPDLDLNPAIDELIASASSGFSQGPIVGRRNYWCHLPGIMQERRCWTGTPAASSI